MISQPALQIFRRGNDESVNNLADKVDTNGKGKKKKTVINCFLSSPSAEFPCPKVVIFLGKVWEWVVNLWPPTSLDPMHFLLHFKKMKEEVERGSMNLTYVLLWDLYFFLFLKCIKKNIKNENVDDSLLE